jgi:hypothetical protein
MNQNPKQYHHGSNLRPSGFQSTTLPQRHSYLTFSFKFVNTYFSVVSTLLTFFDNCFVSTVFFFDTTVLTFVSTVFSFVSTLFFFVSTVLTFVSTVFSFVSTLFTFVNTVHVFLRHFTVYLVVFTIHFIKAYGSALCAGGGEDRKKFTHR